jgi:hypothetical protein
MWRYSLTTNQALILQGWCFKLLDLLLVEGKETQMLVISSHLLVGLHGHPIPRKREPNSRRKNKAI